MAGQGSRCSNDAVSVARDSARKFRLNFGRISKTFSLSLFYSLSFFYSPLLNPRAHDETTEGGTVYNHVGRGRKKWKRKRGKEKEKGEEARNSQVERDCLLSNLQLGRAWP